MQFGGDSDFAQSFSSIVPQGRPANFCARVDCPYSGSDAVLGPLEGVEGMDRLYSRMHRANRKCQESLGVLWLFPETYKKVWVDLALIP